MDKSKSSQMPNSPPSPTNRGKTATNTKKKVRFDGLDVSAMTSHVSRTLLGFKVVNIYDGPTDKTYVFKLASTAAATTTTAPTTANSPELTSGDKGQTTAAAVTGCFTSSAAISSATTTATSTATKNTSNETIKRHHLFIESGIRFHPTFHWTSSSSSTTNNSNNNNNNMPSGFVMKLRKHLRNTRLEHIRQLGNLDRVIDIRFGNGTSAHHLIVELYSQGNIILTNYNFEIVALLRTHDYHHHQQSQLIVGSHGGGNGGGDKGSKVESSVRRDGKKKQEDDKGVVRVGVRQVYPVTFATTLSIDGTAKQSRTSGDCAIAGNEEIVRATTTGLLGMSGKEGLEWMKGELQSIAAMKALKDQEGENGIANVHSSQSKKKKNTNCDGGGKSSSGKKESVVFKILLLRKSSGIYHYGPSLIEHCIHISGLNPHMSLNSENFDTMFDLGKMDMLLSSLRQEGRRIINELVIGDSKGYILYRPIATDAANIKSQSADEKQNGNNDIMLPSSTQPHSDKVFEEFQPHLLHQHNDRPYVIYNTFADAVDEFFSLIEGQKHLQRAEAMELAVHDKLLKVKRDQQSRMDALMHSQERLKEHAELVEMNADNVDKAISVITSALDHGLVWDDINQLVKVEQANRNPVASIIHKIDFDSDAMVVKLPNVFNGFPPADGDLDVSDEDDEYEESSDQEKSLTFVTVQLYQSAHANARDMYDRYRQAKDKLQKTADASEKALRAAEGVAQKQLQDAQSKRRLATAPSARKLNWFEKFNWFITSDNYLVIAGRDAQQNELIVKRYLRDGDAYLHADVHGAASCVLRAKRRRTTSGKTETVPLSEQALREAGNFTICRSAAWSSKMVTSAWWVEAHQVSKTAPTGEYLTVGSFMVRGKKNFLPPSQLEMGLAVLFRLGDESSMARHVDERRDFALLETENGDIDDLKSTDENQEALVSKKNKSRRHGNWNVEEEERARNATATSSEASDFPFEHTQTMSRDKIREISQHSPAEGDVSPEGDTSSEGDQYSDKKRAPQKEKKGLSAKDRKLIKKYGSLEDAKHAIKKQHGEEKSRTDDKDKIKDDLDQAPSASISARGKRGKKKKAAKKYADQDEEDRELAMLALHGSEKVEKTRPVFNAESATQKKAAIEAKSLLVKDSAEVANKLSEEVRNILADCVAVPLSNDNNESEEGRATNTRWDKFDADVLEQLQSLNAVEAQKAAASRLLKLCRSTRVNNFSSSLAGIVRTVKRYGHGGLNDDAKIEVQGVDEKQHRKTKAEKQAEKEVWKELLAEEGIVEVDENDYDTSLDDTAELAKLTGKPVGEDVLLYAMPVCAPYQSLLKCKYRIKLTPGSQKRGKASKQCVELFLRPPASDSNNPLMREAELIKLVNENEWVQVICGDVKISAPGASKVAKKQKAQSKKGGKNS